MVGGGGGGGKEGGRGDERTRKEKRIDYMRG